MIFGHDSVQELRKIKELLDLYCTATGMRINMNKSKMLISDLSEEVKSQADSMFLMSICDLDQLVKYLGFHLKPNG